MSEFGQVLTAMVTPFGDDGELNEACIRSLAISLLESGSDGLVIAGTTGESPTLSHDEKLRLFSIVKDAVSPTATIIAGTGTNNTAASIELSREAEKIGVDGLLLPVPPYNKPSQGGLYRHFWSIADAVSKPCILYNIPVRAGVNMSADTTVRLSRHPNIAGVKEASGDLVQIATIIDRTQDENFRVWSGDDAMVLPILAVGGYGGICVTSHLMGVKMHQMIDDYGAGRVDVAAAIHRGLLPLIQVLMTAASNPTPIKFALKQLGFGVGKPRLPLVEPEGEIAEKIKDILTMCHVFDINVV